MAEPRAQGARGAPPILGWLGWAGLDALGRLLLLTGSTIVFTRLVSARDFGVAALVLTIVATAANFVGAPFEEALAQRRHVRLRHFRAALGASLAIGCVILVVSALAAPALGDYYGDPEIRWLLPAAMTQIFFSGHSDIATAMARRQRRFNDVARATLYGHVWGVAVSLALAFSGYALWALVMQRPMIMFARALALQSRLSHALTPAWSPAHAREFGRFASMSFLSRVLENLSYVCFNNVVGLLYGLAVLGQFNMAMRLIEPIRGAITATGHNVAFSFFARAGRDPARLRALAETVIAQAALVTAPVFVGLAVIATHLLPLVAGPGWEPAASIAICLSIGSAIAVPAGLLFTAFSATGRPEMSVTSLLLGFVGIFASLIIFHPLGPISVGLSRIVGDAIRAGFAILAPSGALGWTRGARAQTLRAAWVMSATMGVLVVGFSDVVGDLRPAVAVAAMMAMGVLSYVALLAVGARDAFFALLSHVPLPQTALRRGAR